MKLECKIKFQLYGEVLKFLIDKLDQDLTSEDEDRLILDVTLFITLT